eukprot:scaffold76912_cov57-Phaeocystis_antarctica.AAC.4
MLPRRGRASVASAPATGTPLIHAAAIIDFDILVGDCVCARYPVRAQARSVGARELPLGSPA